MSPRILFVRRSDVPGTLSAFFDECGQENKFQPDTKYYLLTVVLHDQDNPIDDLIRSYEASLRESSLPDVPFHAYDLQHRRGGYEGLDLETRKKLFAKFEGLVRRLPVTYRTLTYRRSEFRDAKALSERMRRTSSAPWSLPLCATPTTRRPIPTSSSSEATAPSRRTTSSRCAGSCIPDPEPCCYAYARSTLLAAIRKY